MINTDIRLILASKSPRRQELLMAMGYSFELALKEVDESFPAALRKEEVALYICNKKAAAFLGELCDDQVVITADTIVCVDQEILGKPADRQEAFSMLRMLSARTHEVITAVSLRSNRTSDSFYDLTSVSFNKLSDEEISYYIDHFAPFDKAGAYGIQEWIGAIGISNICGSYNNVVGLPTEKLYRKLQSFK